MKCWTLVFSNIEGTGSQTETICWGAAGVTWPPLNCFACLLVSYIFWLQGRRLHPRILCRSTRHDDCHNDILENQPCFSDGHVWDLEVGDELGLLTCVPFLYSCSQMVQFPGCVYYRPSPKRTQIQAQRENSKPMRRIWNVLYIVRLSVYLLSFRGRPLRPGQCLNMLRSRRSTLWPFQGLIPRLV